MGGRSCAEKGQVGVRDSRRVRPIRPLEAATLLLVVLVPACGAFPTSPMLAENVAGSVRTDVLCETECPAAMVRPCVNYDIVLPDSPRQNGTIAPLSCDSPKVNLVWNGSRFRGDGSLVFDLSPIESIPDPRTMGGYHLESGEVVPVQPGPLDFLGRLFPRLAPNTPQPAEVEGPGSGSPPGAPSDRVVIRVWFWATWKAPDCVDASGELSAEWNGERVHAQPSKSFFNDLCRMSQPEPSQGQPVSSVPDLAAEALAAVARFAPSPPLGAAIEAIRA